jgi:phosphopantothenoylcysteine decarboxylase/phosphopantothenate--cysteine ligase
LLNKRIVLGVTGGIAAYKSAELTRLLVKAGARVQVAMTRSATQFVTPLTFQALSGQPVIIEDADSAKGHGMAHIHLGRDCDVLLIAPATANFIARLALGLADDVLSAACLARDCPLWLAPAMNRQMWHHPATQRNVLQIQQDGGWVIEPDSGPQACGEEGVGRMREPEVIVARLQDFFSPKPLSGKRVLITAGPTLEKLDPVRAITNLSSGKMGYAVAQAAREAGALVTLISGPVCVPSPVGITPVQIESAHDMLNAVKAHVAQADIFISVAAVADYRPLQPQTHKLKKSTQAWSVELVPNPDILEWVATQVNPPFCVGFAAETERLVEHGEAKRQRKHLPLLAVNHAVSALGSDDNELILLDDDGAHPLAKADKLVLARQLVAHLAQLFNSKMVVK